MNNRKMTIINNRQNYEKDYKSFLVTIVCLQIIFILLAVGFIYYQFKLIPEPVFFLANKYEQITESTPLEQPSMSNAEVINWITEAMRKTFSFNYKNIETRLLEAKPYFDERGFNKFLEILKKDLNIENVIEKKLIVSGRALEPPRIVREGIVNGRYTWQVILPFIIRYENEINNNILKPQFNIYVWRELEYTVPVGISITNFEVK